MDCGWLWCEFKEEKQEYPQMKEKRKVGWVGSERRERDGKRASGQLDRRWSVDAGCVHVRCEKTGTLERQESGSARRESLTGTLSAAFLAVTAKMIGQRKPGRRERGLLPGLQWTWKGRQQMRREWVLADSCCSNSDANDGRERENTVIYK